MPLDILEELTGGSGGGGTGTPLDGVLLGDLGALAGPYIGYVERLRTRERWLVSVQASTSALPPVGPTNFIDLDGDGQADLRVVVRVHIDASGGGFGIVRAGITFARLGTSGPSMEAFRLVLRVDGNAVWPQTQAPDGSTPFVAVGFPGDGTRADVPSELTLDVEPEGLDTDDSASWVPRGTALSVWPHGGGDEPATGQQIAVTLGIAGGPAAVDLAVDIATGGKAKSASSSPRIRTASPTATPYVSLNASGQAVVLDPSPTSDIALELRIGQHGASTTNVVLDASLWRQLGAGGLLDADLAATLSPTVPIDLRLRAQGHGTAAFAPVTIALTDVPTSVALRWVAARRDGSPGTPGADGQDAWIGYVANDILGRATLDTPALWAEVAELPRRVGITHVGDLSGALTTRVGDPNDLDTAMPTGIGRTAVEVPPASRIPPGATVDVDLAGDGFRASVPGIRHVSLEVGAPPQPDSGILDRSLVASYVLDGIESPLNGRVALDDVAGFTGSIDLSDIPLRLDVAHDPGPPHSLTVDQHAHRFGGIAGLVTRPAAGTSRFNRIEVAVARLASFLARWQASDGDLSLVELGQVGDASAPIPGGLGDVAAALDEDAGASPSLALAPSIRVELLTVPLRHLLVAATGLRRLLYRRGGTSLPDDAITVELDGRHELVVDRAPMTHMPRPGSRFTPPYSASLLMLVPPQGGGEPVRRWVHAGHLGGPLTVVIQPGPPAQIDVTGELARVRYEETQGEHRHIGAAVPQIGGHVRLGLGPSATEVETGRPLAVDLSMRAPGGLGDDPAGPHEVALRGAIPAGLTTYRTGTSEGADTISLETADPQGATARVAVGWELDRLTAVRAAPQLHSTSRVTTRTVGGAPRTANFPVALTARIYGLHTLDVRTSDVVRAPEVADLLRFVTTNNAEARLHPARPNRSLRFVQLGTDTATGDLRLISRLRLADLSPHVVLASTSGDEPWQSATEMASLVDGVPIARSGASVGYPGQFPWDGPSRGSFAGIGITEMRIVELPQRMIITPLPFDRMADPAAVPGAIDAGSRFAGGMRFSVDGTLRLRELLNIGWDRSKGDEHAWQRSDIKCLTIASPDGLEHFWLRQLGDRDDSLRDGETTLNVVVTGSARVTMDVWAYAAFVDRSGDPRHADDLAGQWEPKARMQFEGFNGVLQVNHETNLLTNPAGIHDDDSSGDWYVKAVGGFPVGDLDVSLGSKRGSDFDLDAPSLGDPCGG